MSGVGSGHLRGGQCWGGGCWARGKSTLRMAISAPPGGRCWVLGVVLQRPPAYAPKMPLVLFLYKKKHQKNKKNNTETVTLSPTRFLQKKYTIPSHPISGKGWGKFFESINTISLILFSVMNDLQNTLEPENWQEYVIK